MNHFYKDMTGWFTYESYYKELAKKLSQNPVFAEIGCWSGRAISFLAVELINLGKTPTIICVDTWKGSEEHFDNEEIMKGTLLESFNKNISPIRHIVIPMCGKSVDMAKLVADNCLDGVFIDADHSYEGSKSDIIAWLPKVKTGGIVAGHDYYWNPGGVLTVKKATDEIFGENKVTPIVDQHGSCWEIVK